MKYHSLTLGEPFCDFFELGRLLNVDPSSGVIRFAGERTIVLGTTALGHLRRHVVSSFGTEAAEAMLWRFGFAHGWQMARAVRNEWPGANVDGWREAGGSIHMLQGYMRIDETSASPLSAEGCELTNSYEAEQHLLRAGRSREPVCWTLCGVASGYLSCSEGERIYVLEDQCVARGDPTCRFRGKTADGWGEGFAQRLPALQLDELMDDLDDDATMARTGRRRTLRAQLSAAGAGAGDGGMVVCSAVMRELLEQAARAAATELPVLIWGESGVGKEGVARFVHGRSARAGGPFLAINCAAIPDSLLESELFGHGRGAFTGALSARGGLFEAAAGGTLFLDEIGEMSLRAQAKVLRVLQERTLRRVGDNHERAVDVRVVSANKRDLADEMRAHRFREDLYYRLNAVELFVPPLRKRVDDIVPIARAVLDESCARAGRRALTLSPSAEEELRRCSWPGNVRELRNAIERAAAFAKGATVEVSDLPERSVFAPSVASDGSGLRTLETLEKEYTLAVLAHNGGNQVKTAVQLGIAESTLYRKLKKYGGIVTPRGASSVRRRNGTH